MVSLVATGALRPGAVPGGLTFRTLSAGDYATCGVTTRGVAYCWGHNEFGQLGDGTTTFSSVPVRVAGQDTRPLQKVEVTIITTGVSLDPNGYLLVNDEWEYPIGDEPTVSAPTNGIVNLYLSPGGHILSLIDIAEGGTIDEDALKALIRAAVALNTAKNG